MSRPVPPTLRHLFRAVGLSLCLVGWVACATTGGITPAAKPTATPPKVTTPAPASTASADAKATALVKQKCTECHGMDNITKRGGATRAGWTKVVNEMIDHGLEVSAAETKTIVAWLVKHHGK